MSFFSRRFAYSIHLLPDLRPYVTSMKLLLSSLGRLPRTLASKQGRSRLSSSSRGCRNGSSAAAIHHDLVQWDLDPSTRIGTLTLNSPETYNALTVEMGHEFSRVCHQLERDLTTGGIECHAIVLMGKGDKAVCTSEATVSCCDVMARIRLVSSICKCFLPLSSSRPEETTSGFDRCETTASTKMPT